MVPRSGWQARPPSCRLPIDVVMNARSGRDKEPVRARIEAVLSGAGRAHRILAPAHPEELPALVRGLVAEARERPRIVAAAGGGR